MDFVKGQLVRSKAGRDKTRTLAVLEVEGEMLLLADGNLRKVGDPKRKKAKHVAPTTTVLANELLKSCLLYTSGAAEGSGRSVR